MASRRNLKKDIACIIGSLFSECLVCSQFIPGADKEAAGGILKELVALNEEFIPRISHTEPGNAKKYYNAFYSDFNKRVSVIIEKIEKLRA